MPESRYVHRVWQPEDGLRNPSVRAISQSADGYLWLAHDEGLVRFDGAAFTEFEWQTAATAQSRWLVGIAVTRDGSLWTSSINGGVTRFKDGAASPFTTENGLPHNYVLAIFEDSRGALWFGSAGGLTRYENGTFHTFPETDGWMGSAVRSMAEDSRGNLWIGTVNGLVRFRDGTFVAYTKEKGWLVDNAVMTVHADRNDDLWVGTAGGLTKLGADGSRRHFTMADGLAHNSVRAIHRDRRGMVWVGTHGGLQQIKAGELIDVTFRDRTSAGVNRAIQDFVYALFEDREGTLWAGTNSGLHQINLQKFDVVSKDEGLPHDLVTTVYEDREGDVWLATWGGGLSRISEGGIEVWTKEDGLASDHLLALHQDRSGDLWIGTDGFGVNRFSNGEFTLYRFAEARPGNTITAIFEDSRGRLWAGGNIGLNVFEDGGFTSLKKSMGLDLTSVRVIVEDGDGVVWVGSEDGLTRIDGEKHRTYTAADGLSSTMVIMIYPDEEGVLWIGTGSGGLDRFKPGEPVVNYTAESGIFRERILHLLEDDLGYFWMSSRSGIFRVSRQELQDFADGSDSPISPVSFGKSDGMRRAQCLGIAQPSGWKSRDGRLWFPTVSGAVVFDAAKTALNAVPPPVIIERVLVAGREVPVEEALQIPPGQGRVEVHYTATSFEVPEKVRFKHRLEGFDTTWQDGGAQRTVVYQNLPPGNYHFQVIASNNDGVWNRNGAGFSFSLAPYFYQTYWFQALVGLGLIAVGAGVYGLRMRTLKRNHRKLAELVDERTEKLQEEIRERVAAEKRTAVFSRLGQELSLASTQLAAAKTIVAVADELIGWDSCGLHAYSSADESKISLLHFDMVDGVRTEVHPDRFDPTITPMMRRTIEEGPQLVLRDEARHDPGFVPFGDVSRPSASLMFAPMRNGPNVVGILSAQSYSVNAYDERDLETLQALADYCGGALERIRTQEALRESQNVMLHQERLAAIGQLSSGAAHEFNNILTIIQGHSSLLLEQPGLAPDVVDSLREISGSADRAANLTKQLLTFSRKQYMRQQVVDLNDVIREVAMMLSRVLGDHITVRCDLEMEIPPIRADRGMMEQIMMNLAVNARDAMAESGGELTIRTGGVELTQQHPHPESRAGEFLSLSVTDTGCGMDAETLRRIFEPFFTTKGVGEGTGLGLASVYGIVKQHRGWIEVNSRIGKGTTFDIYLPATDEELPSASAASDVPEEIFSGKETILLVEDEPGLRKMVRAFLEAMDYSVLDAGDGAEALRIWHDHAGQIDLLLTDMVLPKGISGRELARRLRELDPTLPVILTSGYSQEILGENLIGDDSIAFVAKPYHPAKLAEAIRDRLGRGDPHSIGV